jgi:apolipoprotein D and lipocalin family protein
MKILIYLTILVVAAMNLAAQETNVRTVPSVDLDRYSGKWFEVARYPNKFQKDCIGNVAATYSRQPNGRIAVLNECLKSGGKLKSAKGEAKIVDTATNAKLKVRFAPKFLSAFGFVWGDYWVLDLGPEYEYAVVGDPSREYLWILSRNAEMSDSVYQDILRRVEAQGFDSGKLNKTPQGLSSAPATD